MKWDVIGIPIKTTDRNEPYVPDIPEDWEPFGVSAEVIWVRRRVFDYVREVEECMTKT